MTNFYDLASKMQESEHQYEDGSSAGPASDGATTMNMISYLPTQVGVVRAALSGLGKKKKKWNLEILEDDTSRTVCFEEDLKVAVPNEHWDHFQSLFDSQLDNSSCFVLPSFIMDNESLEDAVDLDGRRADVHLVLESALDCPEIRCAQQVYNKWTSRFKPDKDLTSEKVMFPLYTLTDSVEKVYQKLVETCSDDRGQLEMLSESLEEKAFDTLQKTGEHTILAGARVHSTLDGVGVIFEARVGFDKTMRFSVLVEDDEIADRLQESLPGVRRVGSVFYLRPGLFACRANVQDLLVEAIHDLKGEKE